MQSVFIIYLRSVWEILLLHKHTHTTPSTVYTVHDVAKSLLEGERIQVKVNHKGVVFHITTTYRIDYLLSINGGCIDVTIGDAFYITSY